VPQEGGIIGCIPVTGTVVVETLSNRWVPASLFLRQQARSVLRFVLRHPSGLFSSRDIETHLYQNWSPPLWGTI
jgi:hypothetical protein